MRTLHEMLRKSLWTAALSEAELDTWRSCASRITVSSSVSLADGRHTALTGATFSG